MKLAIKYLSALVAILITCDSALSALIVNDWMREIDLSSQLAKVENKIKIQNEGAGGGKQFEFLIEKELEGKVLHIEATSYQQKSGIRVYLRLQKTSPTSWVIELDKELKNGESSTIVVNVLFGKSLEMYPKQISQKEKQLVLFNGNHYAYSPYKVKSVATTFVLPNTNIEQFTKTMKPVSSSDNKVSYGPYLNVAPISYEPLTLHFENNNPFLIVTKLERTIELSMWGNIAVEEILDIRHAGASLKGSFSRYDFQRENSGVSAVKSFKTVLPAAATDVYYRDDIGNISTSALKYQDDSVEVDLRPRFPLFGGWKTHYVIGYNVPSYEYLYKKNSDSYILNMRLLDHVFDDMIIEDLTVKVILPEKTVVGELKTPYPMNKLPNTLHFTYLDTVGRPVITRTNIGELTEKHIQDFQLTFKYPRLEMVRELLLLISAFFVFFVLTIIYVRLDFSITKDENTEAKMKIAGYCEKILCHQDRRENNQSQFKNALAKLKSSKDSAGFQSHFKKIQADQKNETQCIADINTSLKLVSQDAASKVEELQGLDRSIKDLQEQHVVLVERLISGKLSKVQFIEQETDLMKSKDKVGDRTSQISAFLRAL